jgi:hypothetical protein
MPLPSGTSCDPGNDCQQNAHCDGSGACISSPKSDGAFCRRADCGEGVTATCLDGACQCSGLDLSVTEVPRSLVGHGKPRGCTVGGDAQAWGFFAPLALLVLLGLALVDRSRTARRR